MKEPAEITGEAVDSGDTPNPKLKSLKPLNPKPHASKTRNPKLLQT